jgi:DNA topoisomerase-6 subunit B
VASTHIPFTSESKEAIADVPEIMQEVELAIKDVARKLKTYLSKQDILSKRREKEEIIQKILPRIARKVAEILDREPPDITPVVAKIMGNILVQRRVRQNGQGLDVEIRLKNHGEITYNFRLNETIPYEIRNPVPPPEKKSLGKDPGYLWNITLRPREQKAVTYSLPKIAAELPPLLVEGVDEELVTGAKTVRRA